MKNSSFLTQDMELSGTETGAKIQRQREKCNTKDLKNREVRADEKAALRGDCGCDHTMTVVP